MSERHDKSASATPQIVIALYRPRPGKDAELRELIGRHMPTLRRLDLVTDRPSVLARAGDGTYVEVFEWRSGQAAALAHEHPELVPIWEGMGAVADFPALGDLGEAKQRFPHFEPVSESSLRRAGPSRKPDL